jgi:hypothetical protein
MPKLPIHEKSKLQPKIFNISAKSIIEIVIFRGIYESKMFSHNETAK